MKRYLALALVLFTCHVLDAADFSDVYGKLSNSLGTTDNNTGLTVFPLLSIPLGGQYQGMGTAFTAVAWDSSYLYANPSASSVLNYTELSVLHNNWIADSNLEGVVYTMRINDLGLGVGGKFLYVPFEAYNGFGIQQSQSYYSESLATLNVSYNFFSSYYFYGLALGANIKLAYRGVSASIAPGQSALAPLLDVGALTRFNFLKFYASRSKNFSVGVVLKNLGPLILGEPLPTEVTAGIAYSPWRPVTFAFDLNVPISYGQPAEPINMAGGLNVAVTSFFSAQAGFRYKGNNPAITLGSTIDLKQVSIDINYMLDLTTQLQVGDKFSVEATLNLGDQGRGARQAKIDEYYTSGIQAFADGNLEESINDFKKALELDPGFVPAQQYLALVQQRLENQKKLDSLK